MNAKLGTYMMTLGFATLGFYGAMMAMGLVSIEFLPQFAISAVLFLSSGRIMRKMARRMARDEAEEEKPDLDRSEPDWPWLTGLLNWSAALLVVGVMAVFLMKPLGLSFQEALNLSAANDHFFATAVP